MEPESQNVSGSYRDFYKGNFLWSGLYNLPGLFSINRLNHKLIPVFYAYLYTFIGLENENEFRVLFEKFYCTSNA